MKKPTTWTAYKKAHDIKEIANISMLKEEGFLKLDLGMKKSTDPRRPAQIVAEAVEGEDYEEVVYHDNQSYGARGSTISIYAKPKNPKE